MTVIVPTQPNVPWYRQRTTLEGRDYVLSFRWNERSGRWYMDVSDQDEVPLAVGVKLVPSYPLLGVYIDDRLPPGQLLLVDMEDTDAKTSNRDPGLCHLGERFKLIYMATEIAAA